MSAALIDAAVEYEAAVLATARASAAGTAAYKAYQASIVARDEADLV